MSGGRIHENGVLETGFDCFCDNPFAARKTGKTSVVLYIRFVDIKLLQYPRKSHRKPISLPPESVELAEFMGIVLGDGGINNAWQLVISMNAVADLEYSHYLTKQLQKLFKVNLRRYKRPGRDTLELIVSSTTLVDFLIEKGAVRGDKIRQRIDVPKWISGNQNYERAFMRGLVDTDGCLYIHKHKVSGKTYHNIGFCFTSLSKKLLSSAAQILRINGVKPHIMQNGTRIYLYSEKAVTDYLAIFGSSNPRIYGKFKEWRGARAV